MALARIYPIDKHFVIQEHIRILQTSAPEFVQKAKYVFTDLLFECFGSPLALSLNQDQQQIAITNASQYLNGQSTFLDLVI